MKELLQYLFEHNKLDKATAKQALLDISQDKYNDAQVTSFITVFLMRSITVEELAGFREALLELCVPVDLGDMDTIDLCGTGGDGKNTFNISTLSSFVVAGAGYKVVKHGNYGVSSACGSSNVLESMGYQFTNDGAVLKRQLELANICFFHAPLFHPALKGVGPIRRKLGMKTFFNMLGPLVNPAQPNKQLVGVYNLQIAKLYHYLYQDLKKSYSIVHALDGYDEVSLTGEVKLINNENERVVDASYFGLDQHTPEAIFGGESIEEASSIFQSILQGAGTTAQNNVVLANAALGIQCFDRAKSIEDCVAEAKESLESGKALNSLVQITENQ